MPDPNKFQVLRSIGYQVRPSCGFCKHGMFGGDGRPEMSKRGYPGYGWGTCATNQYQHGKHTGPARQMSIYHAGWCPGFELDPRRKAVLGSFIEFLGESS